MGACYNTILFSSTEQATSIRFIQAALHGLGCKVVHLEQSDGPRGFCYQSSRVVFVAPTASQRWTPLSSWGDGLHAPFPTWYRENPLAAKLSLTCGPVIYFFSFDSGFVAGYSIFVDGKQIEAQAIPWSSDHELADFTPSINGPKQPTCLGEFLGDATFDYETFARSFTNLEIATAALADRLGLNVHLLDPLDIHDGDGGITVEADNYDTVELSNWMAVYYEKESK